MKYIDFYNKFQRFGAFSLHDIQLLEPSISRSSLHKRNKEGQLISISPGIWAFREKFKTTHGLHILIANILYQPSYISLERALRYYNLIPEWVFLFTCISTKKTKEFSTPIGIYRYQSITPKLYRWYTMTQVWNHTVALASIEKTVLDYLYFHTDLSDDDAFDEWRINITELTEQRNEDQFLLRSRRYNKTTQQRANALVSYIHTHA